MQFSGFLGARQGVFGTFGLILISDPPGAGHAFHRQPFLDHDTCTEEVGYLFLPRFFSLYDAIHGWMMGWMDGSCDEKSFTKKDHDVLYYM
jgi:hypothetical protein